MDKIYEDPLADVNGIWVVNAAGKLIYIRTPVRVICIIAVEDLIVGITYFAEAVLGTYGGDILFLIFNRFLGHSYFRIVERR